jgi:hypothetical protein
MLESAADSTPPPTLKRPRANSALVALVVALGVTYGCAGTGTGVAAPIAAAGSAFLQCGKQDLTQLVGVKGLTLLAQVYDDLAQSNYVQLIADLVTTVGGDAVGCALVAIASLDKTSGVQAQALTPREVRAQELIAKYGWKIPPAPTPAPTSP